MSIAASDKVPGIFLEMVFGVGPVSAADAPRLVCVVAQQSSTGTLAPNVPTLEVSEAQAITDGGQGSEFHMGILAALTADPAATLYGVALTPPGGGTAASGQIILAAGPASADGTINILIAGNAISVFIPNTSSITAAGDLIAAAINALPNLPVTAANAAGTVTVTFKTKGARGNQISFSSSGTVTGITITHATGFLTSGAGTDTLTTAQTNMQAMRFHYIAVPHNTSTDLQSWRSHVNTLAGPTIGMRQQVVAACSDTLSNATTLAIAVNADRVQIVWHRHADDTTMQIAACVAARRANLESIDPAQPLSAQHGTNLPGLRVQPAIADRPLRTELTTALNNGLSPVIPTRDGTCYLGRSITSRSQDVNNAPNYAVLDTSKVTVPDFFADQLQTSWTGFVALNPKLAPDPTDQSLPTPGVATPSSIRTWIYEQQKQLEPNMLVNVDALLPTLAVTIPGSPNGRVCAVIPLDVVEGLYQLDATINQVG